MITAGRLDWNHKWLYAPDAGGGDGAAAADAGSEGTDAADTGADEAQGVNDATTSAEIARLKAELAKAKAATDKATKEAGDYKKQLRSKMSADEAAAEEKRAADEARDKELNELRKRFAVADTARKAMVLGGDETVSNKIAEYLYGAEDAEAALAEIQKLMAAKEKAIRLEFSKIPAPGVGSSDGPTITAEQLNAMGYLERVDFIQKHPEEYNKLMGR
jgi:hypothetical protein